jgi:hypothetical protein
MHDPIIHVSILAMKLTSDMLLLVVLNKWVGYM